MTKSRSQVEAKHCVSMSHGRKRGGRFKGERTILIGGDILISSNSKAGIVLKICSY